MGKTEQDRQFHIAGCVIYVWCRGKAVIPARCGRVPEERGLQVLRCTFTPPVLRSCCCLPPYLHRSLTGPLKVALRPHTIWYTETTVQKQVPVCVDGSSQLFSEAQIQKSSSFLSTVLSIESQLAVVNNRTNSLCVERRQRVLSKFITLPSIQLGKALASFRVY